ncbi:MAG: DUF1646 domain-containing protein [Deltaproteobacteria bacterium]|nr:DUF1646 domain-containing protein [Deltaproteobacteria bacterium]MCL5791513.1 DUF1646 domain-containing protein [Deltaproteobacteria bacterium]
MITYILLLILFFILFLPLFLKRIERNIEVFFFVMAIMTLTLSHIFGTEPAFSLKLVWTSIIAPVKLVIATLVFGLLFKMYRKPLEKEILYIERSIGTRFFSALLILFLGLVSSVITAIIAALILSEVITILGLDKKYESGLVILACFSIGMGAALTPIGEPLSTIAIVKIKGTVNNTDLFFLIKLLGPYVFSGLILVSTAGFLLKGKKVKKSNSLTEDFPETFKDTAIRALKVYVFVMSLVLLGDGFKPLVKNHISKLSGPLLYWINMLSAVVDNATLAAAELGPHLSLPQIRGILMGLIISGGMLIPGNIPNIIAAGKLKISIRTWAKIGIPMGLILMSLYYVMLFIK